MDRSDSKASRSGVKRIVLMLLALSAPGSPAAADEPEPNEAPTATLEVRVVGFDSDRGRLAIALFASDADYSVQENAVRKAWLAIDPAGTVWTIAELPEGEYAVIVYQDENDNGQIDMRLFGMPKEPVGVSNNARGLFGPPRFKAAKFEVASPLTRHEIELK